MAGKERVSVLLLPFTLVHIHIYPKLSFSIKTLPSNSLSCLTDQKKRRFWLIPVNCRGFSLRMSVAAFGSGAHQIYLLSWVSMGLLLLRIDFSIQMPWHLGFRAGCWCECLHKVLFFLVPGALALTALTFLLFFYFDWLGDWPIVFLQFFPSKSFPIFLSALSAIWQKVLSCKDLWQHSWWHWPGTHSV